MSRAAAARGLAGGHRLFGRAFSAAAASPSAILNPSNPAALLTSAEKTRLAIPLLRSASDAAEISSICHAAALSPATHLDRTALSVAATRLKALSPSSLPSLCSSLLLPRHPGFAIVLLGQAGLVDEAISVFRSHHSLETLNSLLFACILAGDHAAVTRVYLEYPSQYRISPDVDTFNHVIKSFSESGTTRSAFSILEEMSKRGIKPTMTTFKTMVAGFYKEGKFDDVKKVVEVMKKYKCSFKLPLYNVMIQSLCKLKRSTEAKELLQEMIKKGMKPSAITYHNLIYGFCKEGNLEEAKRLYEEMGQRHLEPESIFYFTYMFYLCKGGEFDDALTLWKQLVAKNWIPPVSTVKMLVNGLAASNRVDEAKEILGKVKEYPKNADVWKEVEEALPQ